MASGHVEQKHMEHLTLELSGGAAVRLERNVRRLRRSMLGRQRLPRRARGLDNRLPQNYQLWMLRFATTLREKLLQRRATSRREAGRNTPHEEPTRATD